MRVIIAGGRYFAWEIIHLEALNDAKFTIPITEVVSGGARGADRFGEYWATINDVPIKRFPADWGKYKKAAGHIRNQEMADYADAAILFPGGAGTDSMYDKAYKSGLLIIDLRDS